MRKCKNCGGKGFLFAKSSNIFTGKYHRIFGMDLPVTTSGMERVTCGKCFGKGAK